MLASNTYVSDGRISCPFLSDTVHWAKPDTVHAGRTPNVSVVSLILGVNHDTLEDMPDLTGNSTSTFSLIKSFHIHLLTISSTDIDNVAMTLYDIIDRAEQYIKTLYIHTYIHGSPSQFSQSRQHSRRAEMAEVEKAHNPTSVPPYSSPNLPPPGQPSTQQSAHPQQPLAVQAQPPPPIGVQYYTQPAYPAVSGAENAVKRELATHTLTIPPLTQHSHRWSWHSLRCPLLPHSRHSQETPPTSPSMPL